MCGKGQLSGEKSKRFPGSIFFFFPQTSLGTVLLCHHHFLLIISSHSARSVAKCMRPPRQNPNTPQACVSVLNSLVHGHELGTATGQRHSSTM